MEESVEASERARLQGLLEGFQWAQVLSAAVRVGLADALASSPATSAQLAARLGLHAGATERVLRALTVQGLVTVDGDGRHSPTAALSWLVSGVPGSLADVARIGPVSSRAMGELAGTITTGVSGFESAFGQPLFRYLRDDPQTAAAFDGTMRAQSKEVVDSFVSRYRLDDAATVVDVGGGVGHLGAAIATAHPQLVVTVFDLERVAPQAEAVLSGSPGRCSFQAGNFFSAVPSGAEVYLLKWVLHDWDDEHCVRILDNCRASLPRGGKVVIIERLMPERPTPTPDAQVVVLYDLLMLGIGGADDARERTLSAYDELLTAAQLRRRDVLPLTQGFVAITATD